MKIIVDELPFDTDECPFNKGHFVVEANHYCRSQNTYFSKKNVAEQAIKKHIKESLEFYLDSNEENGVVYIPKFIVEKIIEELK